MIKELSKLEQQIQKFMPFNEQEEHDKAILLKWFESGSDILTRENEIAHLTASAWVVSPDKKSVLMAYHNIYHSWAWLVRANLREGKLEFTAAPPVSVVPGQQHGPRASVVL